MDKSNVKSIILDVVSCLSLVLTIVVLIGVYGTTNSKVEDLNTTVIYYGNKIGTMEENITNVSNKVNSLEDSLANYYKALNYGINETNVKMTRITLSVDDVKRSISELNTQNSTMFENLSKVQKDVSSMDSRIKKLEENVENIMKQMNSSSDKEENKEPSSSETPSTPETPTPETPSNDETDTPSTPESPAATTLTVGGEEVEIGTVDSSSTGYCVTFTTTLDSFPFSGKNVKLNITDAAPLAIRTLDNLTQSINITPSAGFDGKVKASLTDASGVNTGKSVPITFTITNGACAS